MEVEVEEGKDPQLQGRKSEKKCCEVRNSQRQTKRQRSQANSQLKTQTPSSQPNQKTLTMASTNTATAAAPSQVVEDSTRSKNSAISTTEEDMNQSRRPGDVALMQQRMKAWQPLLSPRWVIAAYFAIALVFVPVGKFLWLMKMQ